MKSRLILDTVSVGCYYPSSYFPPLRGLHSQFKPLSKSPVWAGARLWSAASWAWAPTPTSPTRLANRRAPAGGWGVGRPSAGPYCPSTHCRVHALCSEDSGGQWGNAIHRLLFPGLGPRPRDDTRRTPPRAEAGALPGGRRCRTHPSSPWQPQLPNCWLEGFF